MTRAQLQQLVVVLLLFIFVGIFVLNKQAPAPAGPLPHPVQLPAAAPEATVKRPEPPPMVAQASASDLNIPRDVFLLPNLLIQRLQQRDQDAETARQKNLQQAARSETISAQQAGMPDLQLQGIFWGIAAPQAIINRKIVSVGDQIEGAEVEAINRDSVILSMGGQKVELKSKQFRSLSNTSGNAGKPWSPNNTNANPR